MRRHTKGRGSFFQICRAPHLLVLFFFLALLLLFIISVSSSSPSIFFSAWEDEFSHETRATTTARSSHGDDGPSCPSLLLDPSSTPKRGVGKPHGVRRVVAAVAVSDLPSKWGGVTMDSVASASSPMTTRHTSRGPEKRPIDQWYPETNDDQEEKTKRRVEEENEENEKKTASNSMDAAEHDDGLFSLPCPRSRRAHQAQVAHRVSALLRFIDHQVHLYAAPVSRAGVHAEGRRSGGARPSRHSPSLLRRRWLSLVGRAARRVHEGEVDEGGQRPLSHAPTRPHAKVHAACQQYGTGCPTAFVDALEDEVWSATWVEEEEGDAIDGISSATEGEEEEERRRTTPISSPPPRPTAGNWTRWEAYCAITKAQEEAKEEVEENAKELKWEKEKTTKEAEERESSRRVEVLRSFLPLPQTGPLPSSSVSMRKDATTSSFFSFFSSSSSSRPPSRLARLQRWLSDPATAHRLYSEVSRTAFEREVENFTRRVRYRHALEKTLFRLSPQEGKQSEKKDTFPLPLMEMHSKEEEEAAAAGRERPTEMVLPPQATTPTASSSSLPSWSPFCTTARVWQPWPAPYHSASLPRLEEEEDEESDTSTTSTTSSSSFWRWIRACWTRVAMFFSSFALSTSPIAPSSSSPPLLVAFPFSAPLSSSSSSFEHSISTTSPFWFHVFTILFAGLLSFLALLVRCVTQWIRWAPFAGAIGLVAVTWWWSGEEEEEEGEGEEAHDLVWWVTNALCVTDDDEETEEEEDEAWVSGGVAVRMVANEEEEEDEVGEKKEGVPLRRPIVDVPLLPSLPRCWVGMNGERKHACWRRRRWWMPASTWHGTRRRQRTKSPCWTISGTSRVAPHDRSHHVPPPPLCVFPPSGDPTPTTSSSRTLSRFPSRVATPSRGERRNAILSLGCQLLHLRTEKAQLQFLLRSVLLLHTVVLLWVGFVVGRFVWQEWGGGGGGGGTSSSSSWGRGLSPSWYPWPWRGGGGGGDGKHAGEGEEVGGKKGAHPPSPQPHPWWETTPTMPYDTTSSPPRGGASWWRSRGAINSFLGISWKVVYPLFLFWGLHSSLKGMLCVLLVLVVSEWRLLQQYLRLMETLHGEALVHFTLPLRQRRLTRGFGEDGRGWVG